jgi:small-conductance mechanosensitive channel
MESGINQQRLIISAIILIAGIAIIFFVLKFLIRKLKIIRHSEKPHKIMLRVVLPLGFFVFILALKLNLPLFLNESYTQPFINQFFNILVIFSVVWIIINSIQIGRLIILSRHDLTEKNNLQARSLHTQLRILERIVIFIVIFIGASLALMTFEPIKRIGVSLFATAGVAGIILGLAAQKAIGTILAGFQLAITQPIRLEDVVVVEGEWGRVEEITLTYVVIRIWDKRRLIVPTTFFIENSFQNWTRVSSDVMGTVILFTDYTIPVNELRKEFEKYLSETELWDKTVANVQVTNATEHTIELRFLMSATDSSSLWDLRVYIRERLIEYLQINHPDKLPKTRLEIKQ